MLFPRKVEVGRNATSYLPWSVHMKVQCSLMTVDHRVASDEVGMTVDRSGQLEHDLVGQEKVFIQVFVKSGV